MTKQRFDDTRYGNWRVGIDLYRLVHESHKRLLDNLKQWGELARAHGAISEPYELEINRLQEIVEWEENHLSNPGGTVVGVLGVSVGSMRLTKASLLYLSFMEERNVEKNGASWPQTVREAALERSRKLRQIAKGIDLEPDRILEEIVPMNSNQTASIDRDIFICHASEDKESVVRELAAKLTGLGLTVWYDEHELTLGDSLRRSIDRGLVRCRFGVVVLSPNFLEKEWPQRELDGLTAREVEGKKVILPIWHKMGRAEIGQYSPVLADKVAVSTDEGIDVVADRILQAVRR